MSQFQLSNNLIFKHPTTFHDIHQSKITTKNIWGRVNEYRDEKSSYIKKTLRKYFRNNLQAQRHWQCDNQILNMGPKEKAIGIVWLKIQKGVKPKFARELYNCLNDKNYETARSYGKIDNGEKTWWQLEYVAQRNKKHKKKPKLTKYRIVAPTHCQGEFVDIPDIHQYSKNCKAQAEAIFGKKHIQNCIENQKILNILLG